MRVIVTRPANEALGWVGQLQAQGVQALALPLIAIGPPADLAGVHGAWRALADYAALMFVSGNAARQFFALKPAEAFAESAWLALKNVANPTSRPRCWATGPGTVQALLAQAIAPGRIDAPPTGAAQFDSQALWQVVASQVVAGASRVLIVRGVDEAPADGHEATGRPWLHEQLVAAGARVDTVLSYRRNLPELSPHEHAALLAAAADGSVWLFSSSQAIEHLQRLAPQQDWAGARAIATHPRIAHAAQAAGFGVVCESRPLMAELVQAIKSLHD